MGIKVYDSHHKNVFYICYITITTASNIHQIAGIVNPIATAASSHHKKFHVDLLTRLFWSASWLICSRHRMMFLNWSISFAVCRINANFVLLICRIRSSITSGGSEKQHAVNGSTPYTPFFTLLPNENKDKKDCRYDCWDGFRFMVSPHNTAMRCLKWSISAEVAMINLRLSFCAAESSSNNSSNSWIVMMANICWTGTGSNSSCSDFGVNVLDVLPSDLWSSDMRPLDLWLLDLWPDPFVDSSPSPLWSLLFLSAFDDLLRGFCSCSWSSFPWFSFFGSKKLVSDDFALCIHVGGFHSDMPLRPVRCWNHVLLRWKMYNNSQSFLFKTFTNNFCLHPSVAFQLSAHRTTLLT